MVRHLVLATKLKCYQYFFPAFFRILAQRGDLTQILEGASLRDIVSTIYSINPLLYRLFLDHYIIFFF